MASKEPIAASNTSRCREGASWLALVATNVRRPARGPVTGEERGGGEEG